MRQLLKKLTDDISAVESKMGDLKRSLTVAKQQENMNKLNEKFSSSNPLSNADNLFDAVQKRVDAADAAAALNKEMVKETNDVEDLAKKYDMSTQEVKADQVEDQLAALKAGLGK
jgi:phage shock protein A